MFYLSLESLHETSMLMDFPNFFPAVSILRHFWSTFDLEYRRAAASCNSGWDKQEVMNISPVKVLNYIMKVTSVKQTVIRLVSSKLLRRSVEGGGEWKWKALHVLR